MPLMRLARLSPAFLVVSVLVVSVLVSASACSRESRVEKPELPPLDVVSPGSHDLVRLQYNDVNDVYRAFIVGGPADTPLRLRNVRLVLMSDEQIAAGTKPHVIDDGAGPLVRAGPRFKIGVLHGVVEQRLDDLDGKAKRKNVVVRTERKAWSPFLTPNLIDGKSAWHTPAVHYPPPVGAGPIVGSGGNGPTRETAWDDYRRRYGFLPQAVRLELEGYALAKDLPKDDPNDVDDAAGALVDAGPAAAKASANVGPRVDGGPDTGAKDNRIIGANSGSKAEKARMQMLAEKRRKQTEEAKRKGARKGTKPTP